MKCHNVVVWLASVAILAGFPFPATAQQESEKPNQPPPTRDLLVESIKKLSQQTTIQTEFDQRVEMFGKTLSATGRYIKGPGDLQMRLDLNIQIPRSTTDRTGATSLLLLVDGKRLTLSESILGASQHVTIDVGAVLDVLAKKKKESLRTLLLDVLGIGGLPQLLRGVDDTMDPDRWVRLPELEKTFEDASGNHVYVLEGQWRTKLLDHYLPPPIAEPAQSPPGDEQPERPIPLVLPTHVVLYLDRDTGFPRRIEYQRHDPKTNDVKVIIRLEFHDAKFGEKVAPENFLGQVEPQSVDLTDNWVTDVSKDAFIEQLEQAAQQPGSSPLRLIVGELMLAPADLSPPATAP